MKKIILIIITALIVLVLGLFGWRVWYYYKLIKSGQSVPTSTSVHFNKTTGTPRVAAKTQPANLVAIYAPRFGKTDAKITLVEFADFNCSFSAEAFPAIRELLAKYPEKVNFVFRFFPASNDAARSAALAALCAHEQNKFLVYHDKLFQNRGKFTQDDLKNYAVQTGLDTAIFNQCLDSKKFDKQVGNDLSDALTLGVEGTPTFFLNGEKLEGAIPFSAWEMVIQNIK